ncbi:class I tRNA ligase family protein, partial [Candidatus Gracilibacteria bacterium]|nr:class I tRNA ligase family protein [Candidatus Gracilibacteria bacterium]
MDYLDSMAREHTRVWDHFEFDYTDFIRTTETRHHDLVQKVLQKCFDRGDIYEGEYEGMYCVGCEAFKKDEELIELNGEKVCSDHLTVPDHIKEKNYFFRLSRYQTWIEEFYENNPDFVVPNFRYNEVKAFVERGLEDFSISRETNTFGIPLPFDNSQVTYVWFDALFNYYTSCKYSPHPNPLPEGEGTSAKEKRFIDESDMWPANLHVVGKDIIRFHAIFWPAMLASYFDLGEEKDGVIHYRDSDKQKLPESILAGGFFTVDGQKMSKSIGNVIEPVAYSEKYSPELLALYMLSAFPIGNDGDYDREEAIKLYNAKLANNLGNLVNRVVVLSLKLDHGLGQGIQDFINMDWEEYDTYMKKTFPESYTIITESYNELNQIDTAMQQYRLKDALDIIFSLLSDLNKFADTETPWSLLKTDTSKAEIILYIIARRLVMIGFHLYPFFPQKMSEMFGKFGLKDYGEKLEQGKLKELQDEEIQFNITEKGSPLFERFDV